MWFLSLYSGWGKSEARPVVFLKSFQQAVVLVRKRKETNESWTVFNNAEAISGFSALS